MKRLFLGLLAAVSTVIAPLPVFAAPPPNISQTVGVCDPSYPTRCLKPLADGSINVNGGGGGGGAVTIADGADVTQGAKADAAATDSTSSWSVVAILKGLWAKVNGLTVAQGSTTSGQTGQLVQCAVTTAAPSYTTAQTSPLSCDTAGNQRVTVSGISGAISLPTGAATGVAQASTTSGQAGTLAQCAVTTANPTYTNNQTDPLNCDTSGNLRVVPNSQVTASSTDSLTTASANAAQTVASITRLYNGTNFDRAYSMPGLGASGGGTGVMAVADAPLSVATAALSQCFLAAASSAQCGTAAAHNLYLVEVANTTADAWVSIYNATSAPSNGAQTFGTSSGNAQLCFKAPNGTSASLGGIAMPVNFTTGIYLAVSSTACGTLTLATTAIVIGFYK